MAHLQLKEVPAANTLLVVDDRQENLTAMEALLEGGRDLAADELPAFKARLHDLLDQGRDNSQRVIRRSRRALRAGGDYVGEHPWQTSLVLAITCGVLAACVMSRHH